jgi:hypothetical protein
MTESTANLVMGGNPASAEKFHHAIPGKKTNGHEAIQKGDGLYGSGSVQASLLVCLSVY